jgi:hypothetical protein
VLENSVSFKTLAIKNNMCLNNKILWYNIKENGCIEGNLNNEPAVYIFANISDEKYSYVGSTAQLLKRLSCHKSCINN